MHTCRRDGGEGAAGRGGCMCRISAIPFALLSSSAISPPLPSPPLLPPAQPYYVTGTLQLREEDDTSLCHPLTVPHPVSSSRRALVHLPKNKQCPSMVSCPSDCADHFLFIFIFFILKRNAKSIAAPACLHFNRFTFYFNIYWRLP